jgi:hypothetical protein
MGTNQIATYQLQNFGSHAKVRLTFTNHATLEFLGTQLVGVRQPESLYGRMREKIHVKEFVGKWRLSDDEALALARKRFRELVGQLDLFPLEQKPIQVIKPDLIGTNIAIPRILFRWEFQEEQSKRSSGAVRIEIDADRGRVVSMNWESSAYARQPRVLDMPIGGRLPDGSGDLYLPPLGHPN